MATLLALLAVGSAFDSAAQGVLSDKALVDELSKGGYVIYMRHTATDRTQKDSDVPDLSNCDTQRNLNDEGRKEAALIGKAFRQFGIGVEEIFSSPYCRAVDTATIMFGRATQTQDLRYLTRPALLRTMRRRLASGSMRISRSKLTRRQIGS